VHSAVVHLTALPAPRFPADPKAVRVVAAAFNQRRKMLRASLRGVRPTSRRRDGVDREVLRARPQRSAASATPPPRA
jgi:16S rRNA A1518/A1519 N6-dimethyltransferase RsmA/KsgA/DIM1 with predicted DNA glycosylase/AP lyase activity